MNSDRILFTPTDKAIATEKIRDEIVGFKNAYINATKKIILASGELDIEGETFFKCASLILSAFGMTRNGPFKKGMNCETTLRNCWSEVGARLIEIKKAISQSGHSRDRLLLKLDNRELEEMIEEIWAVFKLLLPFTNGRKTYGLVGASKILFAVLPEIILPTDTSQWLHVFKTVDMGDIIRKMAFDIRRWEDITGERFNEMDNSMRLTTLPSVYNVMAMRARPKNKG